MNFLLDLKNSIYGPKYYQELLGKPFSYSVKYFAIFSLLFCLLFTAKLSFYIVPGANTAFKEIRSGIVQAFPNDLVFRLEKGAVSINKDEPYAIETPTGWKNNNASEKNTKNLLVIDTGSAPDATNLEKFDTLLLITKNHFIYEKQPNQIVTQSLSEVPDFLLDKPTLQGYVDKFSPYLSLLLPIIIFFVFIGVVFMIAFKLIYLLLASLVVMLVANGKKAPLDFSKAYQLSLHLMTLPLLLVTGIGMNFPFATTILILALALINIVDRAELAPVPPAATGPDQTNP
jgi:hypothetical protein